MFRINDLIDEDSIQNPDRDKKIKIDLNTETQIPWIEKYRPDDINDISSQDEVKKMLQKTLETGDLPHLLFYGPPGTGKTSMILAVARKLFGPKVYRERVVELNASDERGIKVVRDKIGIVAKSSIGVRDPDYPCPDFRIVILDEADAMTNDAQSALRRMIEDYSHITRFCVICNYINQIIEPIASRCVKFRFKPVKSSMMFDKLRSIANKEKLDIKDKHIKTICDVSEGDMRKGITYLQNTKYITITDNSISDMCNIFPEKECSEIINICKKKRLSDVTKKAREIKRSGFSALGLLRALLIAIMQDEDISEENRNKLCYIMANSERKIVLGADEYVQTLNILCKIYQAYNDKIELKKMNLI